jgi:hypothetical protein
MAAASVLNMDGKSKTLTKIMSGDPEVKADGVVEARVVGQVMAFSFLLTPEEEVQAEVDTVAVEVAEETVVAAVPS